MLLLNILNLDNYPSSVSTAMIKTMCSGNLGRKGLFTVQVTPHPLRELWAETQDRSLEAKSGGTMKEY